MSSPVLERLDPTVAARAESAAVRAAARAQVQVLELTSPTDLNRAAALLTEIWRSAPEDSPMSAHLMRAIGYTGGFVYGAYAEDGELLGVSVGFLSEGDPLALHSHISGVDTRAQGRGLGFALKLRQRAWALGRGIESITWTFDPLVRRNALFNIVKLGARVEHYLTDFYGSMHDGLNNGDESDRLFVRWSLSEHSVELAADGSRPAAADGSPRAAVDGSRPAAVDGSPRSAADRARLDEAASFVLSVEPDGRPRIGDGPVVGVGPRICQIPPDIERLRVVSPRHALEWRHAVRAVLGGALADGFAIDGFHRSGAYLLVPKEHR